MANATEGRNTKRRNADQVVGLVNNAAVIYAGTLVTRLASGGNIVAAGTASAGRAVGVAETSVTGDGTKTVEYRRGTFQFANSASGDLITLGDVGSNCFIVDNQTVAKTDGSSSRQIAGKIIDVDAGGVWVEVG